MQNVYKALIDEGNCIGCRKCINVCPTDAIVGAKKVLHSIIPLQCTSCEACINACPTECISLTTQGSAMDSEQEEQLIALKRRRLNRQIETSNAFDNSDDSNKIAPTSLNTRKQSIAEAIARAKAKRQLM